MNGPDFSSPLFRFALPQSGIILELIDIKKPLVRIQCVSHGLILLCLKYFPVPAVIYCCATSINRSMIMVMDMGYGKLEVKMHSVVVNFSV